MSQNNLAFENEITESQDNTLMKSGIVISADEEYTGLLDIFNEPPPGKKLFCG